jgi:sugar transferase (PEP-CTERM/EpsH1 system associated)
MPVDVLYLITELSMGGAQRALLHLLCGLNRERFAPTVACLYNGDGVIAHEIQTMDIPVFDARMCGKADLKAFNRLYQHVRSVHPTILHSSLFHANLPGRITGRCTGVPIIISSERTMAMESEWRYRLNRWTISMVDRVVAVSKEVGEFCVSNIRLPAQKVVVIHNGVEIPTLPLDAREQARLELGLSQDALVCGAVSRLDPVKGIKDLLLAFSQVGTAFAAYLVIIGEGSERQHLEQVAQEIGVMDRVIWAGYRANVPSLLTAFDIFVQPSLHEGLPNTVLEAMAAGIPVVATRVGGTPELVVNGKTGMLVPKSDPDSLADVITLLLESPEARESMGRAGRQRVQQHFSVEKMVQKTEQLYEELLMEKGLD